MIEGDGNDSVEAGPSRTRYLSEPTRHVNHIANYGNHSTGDEREELEEVLRENEVSGLEETLLPTRSSISQPDLTPLGSRPSIHPRRSTAKAKLFPLSGLDIPLHTSSSEIFELPSAIPQIRDESARPTTYSSLPPSPREPNIFLEPNSVLDFSNGHGKIPPPMKREGSKGLGIKDLDKVLEKLNASLPERLNADANQDEEERFWPARSRRGTDGEDTLERHIRGPEYEINLDEEGVRASNSDGKIDNSSLPSRTDASGIWDLLKDEMGAEDWDGWIADGKWERIANFLAVPLAVEKTTLFGALLCLDGFLYNFTILPIRATFALINLFNPRPRSPAAMRKRQQGWWLNRIPLAHQHSILRMLLLFIPTVILLLGTDASKMYHSVRGQDTIKLYVIFNALEIADRLCGAFGQDVLDTLFARETLSPSVRKSGKGRKRQQARPLFFFALSLGYVLVHTLIFFYMLVSLNVAINSYDYTLLSLLISNQFVEIKGSVFKKFEKENLFQIMCADIVERFQLSLMLSVIAVRNMIEMAGSEIAFLPRSFMRGKSLVDAILSPILFVIVSEMVVDWLKHAFITKFNHVRASVYERFTDVLAKDVLLAGSSAGGQNRLRGRGRNQVLLDQSPLVARRLGFASIPLACLVIRIGAQAIGMLATSSHRNDGPGDIEWTKSAIAWTGLKWGSWIGVGACAWGCLIFLKVLLGLSLLSFSATRQEGMEAREAEDAVNDFGRSAVGESKEETEYHKQTTAYLSQLSDDLPDYASPASAASPHTPYALPKSAILNQTKLNADAYQSIPSLHNPRDTSGTDKQLNGANKGKKGKKWKLEEVERWTMVKRIW